jgi:hypothetical protein
LLPDADRDQGIEVKQNFYQKALQWNFVPRARIAVDEAKARKKAGLVEALGDTEPAQGDPKFPGPTHVEYKKDMCATRPTNNWNLNSSLSSNFSIR